MLVSAVICAHNLEKYGNLVDAVTSLQKQTHPDLEIIIAIDGDEEFYSRVLADYGSHEAVKAVLLKNNVGVSAARNAGIKVARGEIIAFMDDDAVAERDWIENLLITYKECDAVAVGGKVLPIWLDEKPDHLPEELYWLVGVTHDGFAGEEVVEVRNTFGPNMSFKREVFEKVGGFRESLGFARRGTSYIQAEEPELALRMKRTMGKGVVYNPHAIVYHRITKSKLEVSSLLWRSFYQGYSKALLGRQNISSDAMATERAYLKSLLLKFIPLRIKRLYRLEEMRKLSVLIASILSVCLGFVYGYVVERVMVRERPLESREG